MVRAGEQSASFLGGRAAAASIATINVLGTGIGGFIGPTLVGFLKERTGDYVLGMRVMAAALVASALIILALGRAMNARPALAQANASPA